MKEGVKKAGKIALWVVTPIVIMLVVYLCIWAYKKHKNKKESKLGGKLEPVVSENKIKNDESIKSKIQLIERKSGVVRVDEQKTEVALSLKEVDFSEDDESSKGKEVIDVVVEKDDKK